MEEESNENMEVGGHRKIGSSKLVWSDVIRKNMTKKQIKIEEAQDRRIWRMKTYTPTPNRETEEEDVK